MTLNKVILVSDAVDTAREHGFGQEANHGCGQPLLHPRGGETGSQPLSSLSLLACGARA